MSIDPIAIIDRFYASPQSLEQAVAQFHPDASARPTIYDDVSAASLRYILLTHSRQVADCALFIVDSHPEWIANGAVSRDFVYEAALLHDIGIFLTSAPRIHCHGAAPYIHHGTLGATILRSIGLDKHARVAERHTGSGLTVSDILRQGLSIPLQDYLPETLEEQIVCYADKFYSKTHLSETLSVDHIRRHIAAYGPKALARWEQLEQTINCPPPTINHKP